MLKPDLLTTYQIDPARGFLPAVDPLERLPAVFEPWERLASMLPALLLAHKLRPALEQLPPLEVNRLEDDRQRQRAMLLLSILGHAYVWGEASPARVLPRGIAVPWWQVAEKLGRPPIASHASIVLYNWRLLDKGGPLDLNNLAGLQLFWGGWMKRGFIWSPSPLKPGVRPRSRRWWRLRQQRLPVISPE